MEEQFYKVVGEYNGKTCYLKQDEELPSLCVDFLSIDMVDDKTFKLSFAEKMQENLYKEKVRLCLGYTHLVNMRALLTNIIETIKNDEQKRT